MKYIKLLEGWGRASDPDPDPVDPVKERELKPGEKLFTTIGFTGWIALVYKDPNPRDLWIIDRETKFAEDHECDYTWGWPSDDDETQYMDPDDDTFEDMATDIFKGVYGTEAVIGSGMEGFEKASALVKVDEDLAVEIIGMLTSDAYEESASKYLQPSEKAKRMREAKAVIDALVRAFPGAADRL